MRPGQNKRLRGRSNNSNHGRKGPNPLTRSFESNGPDVKIRGTAQHIAEKYLQLARDAQSSGDPVMAENYLQHAEHYYRVIAAAQQAQQQAMGLLPKPAQEVEDEDEGIEEDDRFASVADRLPQPPQMQQPFQGNHQNTGSQQPFQGQPNGGGQSFGGPQQSGGERQPFGGGERQQGGGQRPWRDRNEGRGDRPDYRDNNRGERSNYRSNEQRGDNRNDDQRGDNRGEQRNDNRGEQRHDSRNNEHRSDNRSNEPRGDNRSEQRSESTGERQDRPDRGNSGQQMRHERRGPRTDVEDVPDGAAALPSFITGGARPPSESTAPPPEQGEFAGSDGGDAQGYHLRPRRRRRGRPDNAGENEFGGNESDDAPRGPETAPVSD